MRPAMTLELLATPAEVSGVRRALRAHGIDVQLCASELVTNVIRHVGEGVPVTVRVWPEEGGRVRLGVTDPAPRALPVLVAAAGAEAESGPRTGAARRAGPAVGRGAGGRPQDGVVRPVDRSRHQPRHRHPGNARALRST